MTTSKDRRLPMIADLAGRRSALETPALGAAPLALAGAALRWVLPLVVTAGGIAVSGYLIKSSVPEAPFSLRNLAPASLLGGFAAAFWFGADLVPKKWRAVPYVASALAAGGSLYLLFKPEGEAAGLLERDERRAIPPAPSGAYRAVEPIIESPEWGEDVWTGFLSRNYTVRILWVNNWPGPLSFMYRFTAVQAEDFEYGRPSEIRTIYPPNDIARINFTQQNEALPPVDYDIPLFAGAQRAAITLNVEIFDPNEARWVTVATQKFFAHSV